MAAREALQAVDGIVEGDDGRFGFGAEDLFSKEDAELAKLREHGVDARAGFDGDDEGERVAADFKVRDFLRGAVVGEEEVQLIEAVDHGAALVADGDGSGDESDAGGEFGEGFWRSLLDGDIGARSLRAFGSLGEGG